MNKIRGGKVLWTGRVLELGTRKVPRLLTIGTALLSQQVVEQVAEPIGSVGRGVLIEGHVEHTIGRGTTVFANGGGGGIQSEGEIMRRGGQWGGPWPVVEEDRLLTGGDLLDRGAWAAAFAINIRHVITNREGVFRMSPVDGGFDPVDIVHGSGTGDINHIRSAPLVRPRDWDGLCGGLCGIDGSLATVGKLARGPSELWWGDRLES